MAATDSECPAGTYQDEETESCLQCPNFVLGENYFVGFTDDEQSFTGVGGVNQTQLGRTLLLNFLNFSVSVLPVEMPSWAEFTVFVPFHNPQYLLSVNGPPVTIVPEGNLPLEFLVNFSTIEVGTTNAEIIFSVQGNSSYPGCYGPNATLPLQIEASAPDLNYLGSLLGVGWFMLSVITFSCCSCIVWVYCNREVRVVKVQQPLFLMCVCAGVLLVGLSILPLSISDENASIRVADMACMAIPWLLSLGFTILFSALFTKLWRINKLLHGSRQYRKLRVTERDVIGPFLILSGLCLVIMILRTIFAPITFDRLEIDDDPTNTMASCDIEDNVAGGILELLNISIIFGAFVVTCVQAYRARDISDEFNESKHLWTAMFLWFQILIIGVPVAALVGFESPSTTYFVVISMVFGVCMSLLLSLFVPIFMHYRKLKKEGRLYYNSANVRISGVSLETPVPRPSDTTAVDHILGPASTSVGTDEESPGNHPAEDYRTEELVALREKVGELRGRIGELEARNRELERLVERRNGEDPSSLQGESDVEMKLKVPIPP